MKLREPTQSDTERIRELTESTMTASYALSPQQIDNLVEDQFTEDRITGLVESSESIVLVLEDEDWETIVGLTEAHLDENTGEVRWLFVDPEHRGKGVGTQLFEVITEKLREHGAEQIKAGTLDANREGGQFFEQANFEKMNDRHVEYGDETFIENVYAQTPAGTDVSSNSASSEVDPAEMELPDTETHHGVTAATTSDDQKVYINRDEAESGTEEPFFATYVDEEYSEQFGYYCSNCGSMDIATNAQDQIECTQCGNIHSAKSAESYDDSYL
ncbi:GNAT family N-acetyltransferase [Haladaptatus caseinilyticus]|uniref:GNAT family N-acetyltransferase n=1 Tax=Haladaptatus caseinilyticus TaxID=2993314 RepID=UPI00224B8712|nr:GNAT family N-acetyltransferase [Haladaptatus caseinilyticus]